MNDHDVMV